MTARIPFLKLTLQEDAAAVREAVERVVTRGWFVLGPKWTGSSVSSPTRSACRMRPASGAARMRLRSRCGRSGSGLATKSSRQPFRLPTRHSRSR